MAPADSAPPTTGIGDDRVRGIRLGLSLSRGELIGDCGFQVLETEPRHAEVGIGLVPDFQGRGYANETLRAVLDYLLVGLTKIGYSAR
jgi:RimJ/RimL family protein N-acetyltransferase